MSKALVIQIGNTDNKLTQVEWSQFIDHIRFIFVGYSPRTDIIVHFEGGSSPEKPWQNYCWVLEIDETVNLAYLKQFLTELRKKFKQDSVAFTLGETEFI